MRSSTKLILVILSTITLSLVTESQRTTETDEEKKELEKLLNTINKPAIKSFQLKPTTIPKWTRDNNTSQKSTSLPFRQDDDITCPPGTVIIKRATLEDLIQFGRLKSLEFKPTSKDMNDDPPGHHSAFAEYYELNYGAMANINIWDPPVKPDQYSLTSIYIGGGHRDDSETIRAGWIVSPKLNQNHSGLFTSWSGYKKGCYNILCPGFVQVSRKFALGILARPVSIYGGQQYNLEVSIYQERLTGDWWFVLKDEPIGYWRNALFTFNGIADSSERVFWGGEVFSAVKQRISPFTGSGFFPQEGFGKGAYMNGLRLINHVSRKVKIPPAKEFVVYANSPTCYNAKPISGAGEYWSSAAF